MLYVDGKLIGTKSGMHKNSTNCLAMASSSRRERSLWGSKYYNMKE